MRRTLEAVALIVTATGLLVGGVAWELFTKEHLGWNSGWRFFVGGAAVYTLATLALLSKIGILGRQTGWVRLIVATSIAELPVLLLWGLFYRGVLELPEGISPYMVGTILLAPVMAMLIGSFDRRAFRSRRNAAS